MAAFKRDRPLYYGWFIVAACFTGMLCLGEVMWSFGVFFKALEVEFNWSRSLTSSCYTLMIAGYAVGAILAGRLTDRYSARPVFIASALVAGPAIALCSTIHDVVHLQVLLCLAGLGVGGLLSAPASTVQRWFHGRSNAGIALATVMAGVGAGGLVFAPVINCLIETIGWRQTFIFAGIFYLVAVGVSGLVIRPLPASQGAEVSNTGRGVAPARQLARSGRFALITGIMGVSVFGFQVVNVHLVPFATDAGISAAAAAAALGLTGAFSIVGRMGGGVLSGRIGWARTFALSEIGVGLAMLLLMATDQLLLLYCFVGVYGLSQGARAVSVSGTMGRVFGMHSLGELIGIMMAFAQLAGAAGPYAAGYVHDALSSYEVMFAALGIALIVSAGLVLRFLVEPGVGSTTRPEVEQPV